MPTSFSGRAPKPADALPERKPAARHALLMRMGLRFPAWLSCALDPANHFIPQADAASASARRHGNRAFATDQGNRRVREPLAIFAGSGRREQDGWHARQAGAWRRKAGKQGPAVGLAGNCAALTLIHTHMEPAGNTEAAP